MTVALTPPLTEPLMAPAPVPPIPAGRLRRLLDAFGGLRVLVVGDCMLDEYLWGEVSRISPEAPVMVVEEARRTYAAGGASNAAVNVVAMGGEVCIVAAVGDDEAGRRLEQELELQGVRRSGLVVDPSRPTTVKTRVMAHHQQVVRLDREDRTPLSDSMAAALVARVQAELPGADAVLISDYSKGVLAGSVVPAVLELARQAGRPVFANPKPAGLGQYRGLTYLQLNQSEAEAASGTRLTGIEDAARAGRLLVERCDAEAVLITLGARGLAVFEADRSWRHLPVVSAEVYDACGCGDTCIAAATLARAAGADWPEAAVVANLAGNAKVAKLGVVPVTREEIARVWATYGEPHGAEDEG